MVAVLVICVVVALVAVVTIVRALSSDQGAESLQTPALAGPESPTATIQPTSPRPTRSPSGEPPPGDPTPEETTLAWRNQLETGPWPTSHVQGIAIDSEKGFVYYSFTTLLVKTDLAGEIVGTVSGFTGHLGDLDFDQSDGRVYGSLEYKTARAFYIAIFEADKINRVGLQAQDSSFVSTVYLPDVVKDFDADLDNSGTSAGDTADTQDHRYGTSGIDGIAFGPRFGSTDGRQYLTVAYGIYRNDVRTDNDHQVLLQYDTRDWSEFERPLVEGAAHHVSPGTPPRKYFVFTGNTSYGVQSLDYDPSMRRWFLAVYPGRKAGFPNYSLFAVDALARPRTRALQGLSGERGRLLPLADDGLRDVRTGIRGWRRDVPYGLEALGDGLYYLVSSASSNGRSSATLTLERWTGDSESPFAPT